MGTLYAIFLYTKKSPWNQQTNIFIALVRLIGVTIITFMILSPFIKSKETINQKTTFIIAIDNSASVAKAISNQSKAFLKELDELKEQLQDKFEVKTIDLNGSFSSSLQNLSFDKKDTDLSSLLSYVNTNFEASEVKGVLLVTDGIFNKGYSPLYLTHNFPIYTLGVGDTLEKQDLILKNCLFNNIVGKNNKFPITAELKAVGFKGKKATVSIYANKVKLQTKSVIISENDYSGTISFECLEKEAGLKKYLMQVDFLEGEASVANNSKEIYFDVIEARQKIAILSPFPHPDIKALLASFSDNENIDIKCFVEGISEFDNSKYDLIIAYQLPAINSNLNRLLNNFIKENIPVLFFFGGNTNYIESNLLLPNLKILTVNGQFDKVTGILNADFKNLNFKENTSTFLEKNPPLIVPFGEYNLGNGWQTLAFQKVGNVTTNKPLIAVFDGEGRNYGVVFGEGIWQWRMNQFAETQSSENFDELFRKIATLLAQKTDKRKFKCNTSEKSFEENSPVLFKIETYNDIYEPIYGQEIELELKNEDGKKLVYKFTNTLETPNFELLGLKSGIYHYNAKTILSGKESISKGEFSVQTINLEETSTVADFELLRNLSNQTNASFFPLNGFQALSEKVSNLNADEKIFKTESIMEIINLKALFFVLIALLTFEWSMRKINGQV